VTGALRRRWRWALLGLADLAVLALAATVALLDRPTLVTAIGALAALALLLALAYQGRRSLGALAAAVSGAMIGLCLGIAVLG
jgi:membrane-bound acyltransferase YfiQ involved in biofilm formation